MINSTNYIEGTSLPACSLIDDKITSQYFQKDFNPQENRRWVDSQEDISGRWEGKWR